MAASPGRAATDTYKKSIEASYVSSLKDIPLDELASILNFDDARNIAELADNNADFYEHTPVKSNSIKYNTAVYEDDVEDFIDSTALSALINISRKNGDHLSAEKVRILRSARAVIYYSKKGE